MYNAPKKGELFAYTSLCRPILEYADVVWDPHTRTNIRVANFQTLVWDLRLLVILQTFPRLFNICLKLPLFPIQSQKKTASTLKFQYFYSTSRNKFLWTKTKTWKAPGSLWHLLYLNRSLVCGNAYVKHFALFQTSRLFWQPWLTLIKLRWYKTGQ